MPPFPPPVRAGSPHSRGLASRSPLRFFLTVAALSIPFAWLGAVTHLQLYPGIPVAALAFVCPVSAAALLAYRANGAAAVSALLKRAFDFRRIRAASGAAIPGSRGPPAVDGVSGRRAG